MQPHTKAQLLSRRVWDILAMLPTNPNLLESFKSLSKELIGCDGGFNNELELKAKYDRIKQKISELLDPSNLQKFMYSLHIVESLSMKYKQVGCCSNIEHGFKPVQSRNTNNSSSGSGSGSSGGSSVNRLGSNANTSTGTSKNNSSGQNKRNLVKKVATTTIIVVL